MLEYAYRTLTRRSVPLCCLLFYSLSVLHRIIIIASSLQVCLCPISRHAPSLRDILELCASLRGWLKLDCKNVAVSLRLFAFALSLSRALALTTYSLAHTHTLSQARGCRGTHTLSYVLCFPFLFPPLPLGCPLFPAQTATPTPITTNT